LSIVYILCAIIIALVIIFGILILIAELNENPIPVGTPTTSISFNSAYPLNSTATFTVVAPDYNKDPLLGHIHNGLASIHVTVTSPSSPTPISLELVQKDKGSTTFVTAPYRAVLTSLDTDDNVKWLHVKVGDVISATYNGVSTTAIITPPIPPQVSHIGVAKGGPNLYMYSSGNPISAGNIIDHSPVPQCMYNSLNDGICDDWVNGWWGGNPGMLNVPYGNLVYTLNCSQGLPGPFGVESDCPSINFPNIYLEIDYMANPNGAPCPQNVPPNNQQQCHITQRPSDAALSYVVQKFKLGGYELHIQLDPEMEQSGIYFDTTTIPGGVGDSGVDTFFGLKNAYFGTKDERNCNPANPPAPYTSCSGSTGYIHDILSAKREAFHYALFIHSQAGNTGSSGRGEILGNDMIISLGSWPTGAASPPNGAGTDAQVEATLMHELGHNLNLNHGGPFNINNPLPNLGPVVPDSSINCKPNYISPMNYLYQIQMMGGVNSNPITYSSNTNQLSEINGLSEPNGIGQSMGQNKVWWGLGAPGTFGAPTGVPQSGPALAGNSRPLDWNNDLNPNNDLAFKMSLRHLNTITDCNDDTLQTYSSYNDWGNLYLLFTNSINFATGESSPNTFSSHPDITSSEAYNTLKSIYCTPAGDYKQIPGVNIQDLQKSQICTVHNGNTGSIKVVPISPVSNSTNQSGTGH
jgi:hypothetical protein